MDGGSGCGRRGASAVTRDGGARKAECGAGEAAGVDSLELLVTGTTGEAVSLMLAIL